MAQMPLRPSSDLFSGSSTEEWTEDGVIGIELDKVTADDGLVFTNARASRASTPETPEDILLLPNVKNGLEVSAFSFSNPLSVSIDFIT